MGQLLRASATLVFLVLILVPTGRGQVQLDPVLRDLERSMRELGSGRRLSEDSRFLQSKSGWPAQEREIGAAIAEQDRALERRGSDLERVRTLYGARATSRGSPLDRYLYGRLLGLEDRLSDAYDHFKAAITADPFFYWAWDALGVYFTNRSDFDSALDCFERASQINPTFTKAAFGYAQCCLQTQNYTAAALKLKELLTAAVDREEKTRARLLLAEVYRGQRDFGRCIDELTTLINEGSQDFRVFALRAFCNRQLERWSDAARDYEAILRIDPKEYRFQFSLADCYRRHGRNADAITAYERGLATGGAEMGADGRREIEGAIESLRRRPAQENPREAKLTPEDYINRLLHSADVDRRRQAAMALAAAPLTSPNVDLLTRVAKAFTNALRDPDPIVVAKSLEQICLRVSNERTVAIARLMTEHSDRRVRGMACYMMTQWNHQEVVPALLWTLRAEKDPYVFGQAHEALNALTLAWIERIPPDDLQPEDMVRIAKKWDAWYEKNRDIYRRYEPKER